MKPAVRAELQRRHTLAEAAHAELAKRRTELADTQSRSNPAIAGCRYGQAAGPDRARTLRP